MESSVVDYRQPNPNLKWYLIIVTLLILLVASVGWILYSAKGNLKLNDSSELKPPEPNSSLFDNQSATFNGKITAVNGNVLAVKNNKGVTGEIMTAPNVIIQKITTPPATPSSDLKTIELNKDVNISLQAEGGKYVAVTISYISAPPPEPQNTVHPSPPPKTSPPSLAPVSTASEKPKS